MICGGGGGRGGRVCLNPSCEGGGGNQRDARTGGDVVVGRKTERSEGMKGGDKRGKRGRKNRG